MKIAGAPYWTKISIEILTVRVSDWLYYGRVFVSGKKI